MSHEDMPLARPAAGALVREDLTSREVSVGAETQTAAVAAQATAAVQARYAIALRRPRDLDQVRVALLKECARPGFAAVARYRKPIGRGVEGPSIRFAEAALRCLGNVLPEVTTVYDDETKRVLRVQVTDLEANLTYSRDVTIDKTVERSVLKPGQTPLRVRTNSQGRQTYLVAATEDDLLNKEGALVSKALRTLALRILPGDLLDEAMDRVQETLEKGAAGDPDAARKKIADAFAAIGVQPAALRDYLGHDLGACSPTEIVELRAVYAAIRDGETTWAETLEAQVRGRSQPTEPAGAASSPTSPAPAPAPAPRTAAQLKEEARKAREKAASEAQT